MKFWIYAFRIETDNFGGEFGFGSSGLRALKIFLLAFGSERLDPKFHDILRESEPSPNQASKEHTDSTDFINLNETGESKKHKSTRRFTRFMFESLLEPNELEIRPNFSLNC